MIIGVVGSWGAFGQSSWRALPVVVDHLPVIFEYSDVFLVCSSVFFECYGLQLESYLGVALECALRFLRCVRTTVFYAGGWHDSTSLEYTSNPLLMEASPGFTTVLRAFASKFKVPLFCKGQRIS